MAVIIFPRHENKIHKKTQIFVISLDPWYTYHVSVSLELTEKEILEHRLIGLYRHSDEFCLSQTLFFKFTMRGHDGEPSFAVRKFSVLLGGNALPI